jgi:hypothetical protein
MVVHKPPKPPPFVPPKEVAFVMHYAAHTTDAASGRMRANGTRACDGGPMADLGRAESVIALFQADGETYVAPRWASTNMPHAVTCPACMQTEQFLAAAARTGLPSAAETEDAVFGNPGTIIHPMGGAGHGT